MIKIETIIKITDTENPKQDICIVSQEVAKNFEAREQKTFLCLRNIIQHVIKFKIFDQDKKSKIDWLVFMDYMFEFNNKMAEIRYKDAGIDLTQNERNQ